MLNILFSMMVFTMISTNGSISGIVVNSDKDLDSIPSQPVQYCEVQLLGSENQQIAATTFTERNGTFHFDDVKPGSYFVRIEKYPWKEHVAAVSVQSGQEVDIGKQTLRFMPMMSDDLKAEGVKHRSQIDYAKFDHIRHINGTFVLTVCEFMKEKPALSAAQYLYRVVIIGTLVQTSQGDWLQQSCSESLKSGDFVWPNAVSLYKADTKEANARLRVEDIDSDVLKIVTRPPDEEIDPRDKNRTWAAVFGRLDTRENLVAAPCGNNGKLCGYGFGPIYAPAQLTYRHIRIFQESTQK